MCKECIGKEKSGLTKGKQVCAQPGRQEHECARRESHRLVHNHANRHIIVDEHIAMDVTEELLGTSPPEQEQGTPSRTDVLAALL